MTHSPFLKLHRITLRRLCFIGISLLWMTTGLMEIHAQSGRITKEDNRQEIQLTITVRDDFGKPVDGLKAEDFLIYDHGQQYVPVRLEQRRVPASIVLMIDASLRQIMNHEELQTALLSLQQFFTPADRVAVMQFSDEVVLTQDWHNDPAKLRKALRPAVRVGSKAAIYDALLLASLKLAEADGQRLILLLTSGLNTAGLADMTQALTAVRAAGAGIHIFTQAESFIAAIRQKQSKVLKKGATIAELREIETALQIVAGESDDLASLAEQTNGRIYFPTKERSLKEMLAEAISGLHAQYLVTYCPERSEAEHNGIKILVRGRHVAYSQGSYQQAAQK